MSPNRLKLNASKTESSGLVLDGSSISKVEEEVEEEALMVGGQSVTPMVKGRDLGVFIDRELHDSGGSREQ